MSIMTLTQRDADNEAFFNSGWNSALTEVVLRLRSGGLNQFLVEQGAATHDELSPTTGPGLDLPLNPHRAPTIIRSTN